MSVEPAGRSTSASGWRNSPRMLAWGWATSRGLLLTATLALVDRGLLFGDPVLLWAAGNGEPIQGVVPQVNEYPAALRAFSVVARAADMETYVLGWLVVALTLDGLLTLVLARREINQAWTWVIGAALLGPVTWARVEVLVALLCAIAVIHRPTRPVVSGLSLGLAVLLKLWPLALAAALLPRRGWARWASAVVATVAGATLVEALVAGPQSILEPWRYQAARGIQIESVAAMGPLVAQRTEDMSTVIEFAYRSYQLRAPYSGEAWLDALALLLVVVVGCSVGYAVIRARIEEQEQIRAVGVALVATAVVVANSVFSPQYVLWFLPLVCLALTAPRRPGALLPALFAVCALTHVIFPWGYPSLVNGDDWALGALILRNGAMITLLVALIVWFWRTARADWGDPVTVEDRARTPLRDP